MKFLVVGLGSMGKRRIRLIKENYKDIILIGVDLNGIRCAEIKELFDLKTYSSLDEAINEENPDAAFICLSLIHI